MRDRVTIQAGKHENSEFDFVGRHACFYFASSPGESIWLQPVASLSEKTQKLASRSWRSSDTDDVVEPAPAMPASAPRRTREQLAASFRTLDV